MEDYCRIDNEWKVVTARWLTLTVAPDQAKYRQNPIVTRILAAGRSLQGFPRFLKNLTKRDTFECMYLLIMFLFTF